MTDPANEAILYAISSLKGKKGILINGYGIYSDPITDEMIAKLKYLKNDTLCINSKLNKTK
jgi:hypothetical protein